MGSWGWLGTSYLLSLQAKVQQINIIKFNSIKQLSLAPTAPVEQSPCGVGFFFVERGGKGVEEGRQQQCGDLGMPRCNPGALQCGGSVVAVLGADLHGQTTLWTDIPLPEGSCDSVQHDKAFLISAGLFPKTTEEKMEVDQRSIYVGNVSGRPWSRAHLAAPCPAGRMSEIPHAGTHPPPTKGWLVSSRMLLLCPAQTGNVAEHLPVILSHL